jgi:hypothetical protein
MIDIAKKTIVFLLPFLWVGHMAQGQNIPAVTSAPDSPGFSMPDVPGTLRYGITGTERIRTGYSATGGVDYTSSISGDVGYLSYSLVRPFTLLYSGGYLYSTQESQSQFFQHLSLSQGFNTRQWTFLVSDIASYLPETGSAGISGVPGLGDIGANPPPASGQGLLTNQDITRVDNAATGSAQRQLTGSTSLQASGGYTVLRFLNDSPGIDTNQVSASGTLNHRVDALTNVTGGYTYSQSSFSGQNASFDSQSVTAGYIRQWTRLFSTNVVIGPQRSSSSALGSEHSSLNLSATASASYGSDVTLYTVNYFHGVRTGSGLVTGTVADNLIFVASHSISRYVRISANGAYDHSSTLQILSSTNTSIQTIIGNIQASRELTETLSGYISYGVETQSTQNASATGIAFNGLSQLAAIGITYSPRSIHLGRQ